MLHTKSSVSASEDIVNLVVNGEPYKLGIQPQWTLQYVLQELIGLTGTKAFCTEGACGGCAVIIDGRAILSCMTLALECNNKNIETIEGIAKAKHPLIEAYIKHSCMQCGYCTPGFIVTAKALLDRNADPTEDEIKQALAGNLCRCGTYPQHIKAVLEAARQIRIILNTTHKLREN
jgi:aerobic-type carbon monoxide dehydrogenase small subunit (CoxS/CutS family)